MATLTAKQVISGETTKPAKREVKLSPEQIRLYRRAKRLAQGKKIVEERYSLTRDNLVTSLTIRPDIGNSVSLVASDATGAYKLGSVSCQIRKTIDIEALKASHPEIDIDSFMRDSEPFYVLR